MQYCIDKINNQLLDFASLRRERALIGMPENYQYVLKLLPLLFHYRSPLLLGYENSNVISGIFNYTPDPELFSLLNVIPGSLNAQSLSSPRISGLYSMGSTSSLGQSVYSDLDVWVCIEELLTVNEKKTLQHKCKLIENWAKSQGVELSLFVVDVNRFRNNHHDCLIGDNCGSTQHILLLEEFYRTVNVLAGKLILWFRIPHDFKINDNQYVSYEACVEALVNEKIIARKDWVDFGSLNVLSAEEYFGASLWQLYKSIDSPYKAVLKSLLLETYSWEYPNTVFIAYQMNQLLHNQDLDYFSLDPYYMLLNKVSNYLIAIGDYERLELARQCFYIKIDEELSSKVTKKNWRREILTELVKQWGWSDEKLLLLDNCHRWKIRQVRDVYHNLLDAMMTSYRNLLNFGRRNNIETLISPRDLAILTRKLYASYEVLPGKISIINPNISSDLSEQVLTFIHVKEDRVNRAGWYVYDKAPYMKYSWGCEYLEYSSHLLKLIAWCYFNNLITDKTKLFFWDNSKKNNNKFLQIIYDLISYFPTKIANVTEDVLYAPSEIRRLAIMINLQNDLTERLSEQKVNEVFSSFDIFNYDSQKTSLIGSVDLLYRNSWNEIRILNFEGELSMLEALRTLLNRMHKAADIPDSIEIFCYSKYFKNRITEQVRHLINQCVQLRLSSAKFNLTKFKSLSFAGSFYGLFFERLGVSFHRFDSAMDFYGAISNNKLQGKALNIVDGSNELPREIDNVACEGIIQFIFEDKAQGFDLYVLNEYNQFEIYRNCNGSKYNMIKDVNEFYTLAEDRFTFASNSSINFNLPQFYKITLNRQGKKNIIPYF